MTTQVGPEVDLKLEDEKPKVPFKNHYREANIITRMFYSYIGHLLDSFEENDRVMTEEMIETMMDDDQQTERQVKYFWDNFQKNKIKYDKACKNTQDKEKPSFYYPVRNTVIQTFAWG